MTSVYVLTLQNHCERQKIVITILQELSDQTIRLMFFACSLFFISLFFFGVLLAFMVWKHFLSFHSSQHFISSSVDDDAGVAVSRRSSFFLHSYNGIRCISTFSSFFLKRTLFRFRFQTILTNQSFYFSFSFFLLANTTFPKCCYIHIAFTYGFTIHRWFFVVKSELFPNNFPLSNEYFCRIP